MDPLHVIKFLLLVVGGMVALYMVPTLWELLRERWGDARHGDEELANPPWQEPQLTYSSQGKVYRLLRQRLTMVEDRSTGYYAGLQEYLQDPETGQLWHHYFFEPDRSQVFALEPIDEVPPVSDTA